ncbi:hypothetical protein [Mycobacterium kubicae]|uniref:Uncharacterized protein n=1 Tax=Mycobacterium kubicae TaxID=120959 RepID=A0AAX1JHH8_9MYCO|nr:hypothetical protein [Mycobacterium kubicae]MCV7094186.1 hypothetical protein [Mycobacterium kubicae]ORV98523.1 hypothetical protein AWC13_13855 [Mycobacterium kubicae]QPI41030.1 hypothetical protein I2456_16390 [Mycobacterium kubicae]
MDGPTVAHPTEGLLKLQPDFEGWDLNPIANLRILIALRHRAGACRVIEPLLRRGAGHKRPKENERIADQMAAAPGLQALADVVDNLVDAGQPLATEQ